MGTWLKFKQWLIDVFNIKPLQNDDGLSQNAEDAQRYYETTAENITAIVANTLSSLAFGDADFTIDSEKDDGDERIEFLRKMARSEETKAKRNIAAGLGVGMIATIPYSVDNGLGRRIYTATVTKDRFFITGMQGDDITACAVISDVYSPTNTETYYRWTNYSVENGVYTVANKATLDGDEVPLTDVPKWADIEPEIKISGVDRLPIGVFRCPTANRRPDDIAGVSITFGCDATLKKIAKTMSDIEREYDSKKVKVFADRSLIRSGVDEDGNAVTFDGDLFVKFGNTDKFAIDVFDPAIRESAYYFKLQQHFAFLEKEIGVSRGILTDSTTKDATATEIRRAMHETFCLLDDIHGEYEHYLTDLMYGINVLCNFYNIGSDSEYNIGFDWSYALLEDSATTFMQLMQGVGIGAIEPKEIRMFIRPDETEEQAQEKIDAIREAAAQNSLAAMMGQMGNEGTPPVE